LYAAALARRPTATASAASGAPVTQEYADPNLWESRYKDLEGTLDWYATYEELGPLFREFAPPTPELSVLVVGCGNSALSSEMHQAGYRRIMSIDIAAAAVTKMEEQFRQLGLQWQVMDATKMTFEDDRFDLSIDKGTLDAMMHGGASCRSMVEAMLSEVWRTLRPGGIFILVSHSGSRQSLLDGALLQEEAGVSSPSWERLELRKCRLSAQATLINILRSKLDGRPLAEAFRDPVMLKEAAAETKKALKQMAFLEAFRLFKSRKAKQRQVESVESAAAGAVPARLAEEEEETKEEDEQEAATAEGGNGLRQPFCWAYVLRKPLTRDGLE